MSMSVAGLYQFHLEVSTFSLTGQVPQPSPDA
jgi:hypothetical protein